MVVGLAADGDVALPRPRPRRRAAGGRGRLRGRRPVPPGRRDLRPAGVDPDGQPAGVAQRRRRRLGGALRDRAGARLTRGTTSPVRAARHAVLRRRPGLAGDGVRRRLGRARAAAGLALFLSSSRTVVLATHDAVLRPNLRATSSSTPGRCCRTSGSTPGPGRRRHPPGQDRRGVHRGAGRALRLHRHPARGPGRQGAGRAGRHGAGRGPARRGHRPAADPGLAAARAARGAELASRARSPGARWRRCSSYSSGSCCREPWDADETSGRPTASWVPLAEFVGPGVDLPDEAQGIEVRGDVTTAQTRRLVESAIDTYAKSKTFYRDAAEEAADLDLREPDEGETVVALVSDRHDNIGMDAVARAIADAGGAGAVFDAGDDTSSGKSWEAFSLDSVSAAFEDLDRWAVAGNHDHGSFVAPTSTSRLDDARRRGRRRPGRRPAARGRRPAVQRPRQLARRDRAQLRRGGDPARRRGLRCRRSEGRHDPRPRRQPRRGGARPRLRRTWSSAATCTCRSGRPAWSGDNGQVGYTYTNGTTGGAAYAIALGSKPRREAQVTLLTYRDGRPAGIQPVSLRTDGRFVVGEYVAPPHRAGRHRPEVVADRWHLPSNDCCRRRGRGALERPARSRPRSPAPQVATGAAGIPPRLPAARNPGAACRSGGVRRLASPTRSTCRSSRRSRRRGRASAGPQRAPADRHRGRRRTGAGAARRGCHRCSAGLAGRLLPVEPQAGSDVRRSGPARSRGDEYVVTAPSRGSATARAPTTHPLRPTVGDDPRRGLSAFIVRPAPRA